VVIISAFSYDYQKLQIIIIFPLQKQSQVLIDLRSPEGRARFWSGGFLTRKGEPGIAGVIANENLSFRINHM
jgi:hypothetical protein